MISVAPRVLRVWAVAASAALTPSLACALDLVEVVKQVENAVVRVDTDSGVGSGVIIDDAGLIATNYHVIEDARRATVTLRSGQVREVRGYLRVDPWHDLALLKVDTFAKGVAIRFASEVPPVGAKVAAFGNPKGLSFTTSEGIVSAIRGGKELARILGEADYRAMGYAMDATWIQTTAPISSGNSGGPLVNMNGELVGLNTLSRRDGQNLNFAIGLPDVKRLLGGGVDKAPRDLASLPRNRARPPRPIAAPPSRGKFKLELPTGRVFSYAIFEISDASMAQASSRADADTVVIAYTNGAVYAAAQQQQGVLHGLTLAQYENKEPMVYITYVDGKRHGILKTWNEAGEPMLFAQYVRGRKYGFSCLFDEGSLVMIGQYKNDELQFLQLMSGAVPLEGFRSEAAANQHPQGRETLKRLAELDKLLKRNEGAFRKQVRAFEIAQRRDRAIRLGPEKRRRISTRGKQRAAQRDAFFSELRRAATGR